MSDAHEVSPAEGQVDIAQQPGEVSSPETERPDEKPAVSDSSQAEREAAAEDVRPKICVESPFPLYALPRAWKWMEPFKARVADDFSPQTLEEFIEWWERAEAAGLRSWGVFRDGEMGGIVHSNRLSPHLADLHCAFKKEFWGHGTTVAALRLVFDQLFRDGVGKIMAVAFRDNHQVFGVMKALGMKREGLLVGNTLRGGVEADMAVVGVLKKEFYL